MKHWHNWYFDNYNFGEMTISNQFVDTIKSLGFRRHKYRVEDLGILGIALLYLNIWGILGEYVMSMD